MFLIMFLGIIAYIAGVAPATGQADGITPGAANGAFDIPAQPLASALNIYGAAARIQIFVDTELTSGRRSAPLKGVFTAEGGLENLLVGTGLTARSIADDGYTLVPLRSSVTAGAVSAATPASSALRFSGYSAALQAALREAVCDHADTREGSYRTLVRLWIDASGSVAQAILLTSTGNAARDAVLSGALQNLTVDEPPPDLPQPVTLLLAPNAEIADGYCSIGRDPSRQADVGGGSAR
jgi:hypothetical protein